MVNVSPATLILPGPARHPVRTPARLYITLATWSACLNTSCKSRSISTCPETATTQAIGPAGPYQKPTLRKYRVMFHDAPLGLPSRTIEVVGIKMGVPWLLLKAYRDMLWSRLLGECRFAHPWYLTSSSKYNSASNLLRLSHSQTRLIGGLGMSLSC